MTSSGLNPQAKPIFQTALGGFTLKHSVEEILSGMQEIAEDKAEIMVDLYNQPHPGEDMYIMIIGQKSDGINRDQMDYFMRNVGNSIEEEETGGMFFVYPFKICGMESKYMIHSKPADDEEIAGIVSPGGIQITEKGIHGSDDIEFGSGMFMKLTFHQNNGFTIGELHTTIMEVGEKLSNDVRYTISHKEKGDILDKDL